MFTHISSESKQQGTAVSANKSRHQPFFSPVMVQPKLTVGATDDPFEREADETAERVLRMPIDSKAFFKPRGLGLQSKIDIKAKCKSCDEEEKLKKKNKSDSEGQTEAPEIIHDIISSPGNPLDRETRNFFEPRFGYDFSNVKVHTGNKAVFSSESINAHAYTVGNHVVFNENRFAPQTDSGKKLLAHELTHVVQQGSSEVRPLIQRDDKDKTLSEKWPQNAIRHMQRALRDHKLYTGETSGILDQQTIDGLNKVFYKDSWKNYDHKAVLGILTSKDIGWLIKNKPDEATLNKAKEIKMPDCDLAKGEYLLRIEADLAKSKCITLTDPILDKYIDNNLVDFNAQMLPETNMWNINRDRITSFRAVYKDGTHVDFSPDDLPRSKTRSGSSQVKFLYDFELKKNGKVYPVKYGKNYFVDFSVPNLSYLNGELQRSVDYVIDELHKHATLMDLTVIFGKYITMLGGMASFNKGWIDHFSTPYKVRSGQRLTDLDIPEGYTSPLRAKSLPQAFNEILSRMGALKKNVVIRAKLFEQLIPQLKKFDSNWGAERVRTTDGSIMYLGLKGFALVIDSNGSMFRGSISTQGHFIRVNRTIVVKGTAISNEFTAEYTPVYSSLKEVEGN